MIIGFAMLLTVVAAVAVGRSLGRDDTPRPASLGVPLVDGGRLALAGWSGWVSAKTPAPVRGLLTDEAAATPLLIDGSTVVLGNVRDGEVPRLLDAVRSTDPNGTEMAAGNLRVRVVNGDLAGHAPLTAMLMLVPTQTGTSAAICVGDPRASVTATDDCRSLLPSTVALRTSTPVAASPRVADAASVSTAVRRLDRVRRSAVPALASEPTSGRQARAARRLSSAYADAAQTVRGVTFTTLAATSGAALGAGLSAGARGYAVLAAAASENSTAAFGEARGRVTAADAAISRALAQLNALGYARRS